MKNIERKSTDGQWSDTTEKSKTIVGTHPCKLCGKIREFKSKVGYNRGKDKHCKSCANSIANGGLGFVRPVEGKRLCGKCKKLLPIEQFVKYKNNKTHGYCKICKSEHFKHYQKTTGRFKRHGITKEIFDEMCITQDQKCYICQQTTDKLHIDHNHVTGDVRKLLCKECNMALGLVKENKFTLNNMINYLEEHGCY
jgi:hypothetical protein